MCMTTLCFTIFSPNLLYSNFSLGKLLYFFCQSQMFDSPRLGLEWLHLMNNVWISYANVGLYLIKCPKLCLLIGICHALDPPNRFTQKQILLHILLTLSLELRQTHKRNSFRPCQYYDYIQLHQTPQVLISLLLFYIETKLNYYYFD